MRELTPMQAACWFGRSNEAILAGVSAHLYSEFDGQGINLKSLNRALKRLYQRHEMLRLQLNQDASVSIVAADIDREIEQDDFSMLTENQQKQKLEQKRQHWTHQKLDLSTAQTLRVSISLLNDQRFRLHIDSDMIAIDPSSFRILMEDFAFFYEHPTASLPDTADFFAWHTQVQHDPYCQTQRKRDRRWWQSRLAEIAPAPSLPFHAATARSAQSHRLSARLDASQRQRLQRLAQQHQLTFSALLMGLFGYCLGKMTHDPAYRLNVPVFWREPVMSGLERSIGDFANVVMVNVEMSDTEDLAQFCQRLSKELIQVLGHLHYPGVQVMRDLSRQHGSVQIAPVVFSAAVDFPEGALFSERVHRVFGAMNWAISQGPQVALDVQVVKLATELLINWDIRLDALPEAWVKQLFENYSTLLKTIAAAPDTLKQDLNTLPLVPPHPHPHPHPHQDLHTDPHLARPAYPKQSLNQNHPSTPLNALQKAYLLGRSTVFPLGGVAMQDYREYAGALDLEQFKSRLTEMVGQHPRLRTYIDAAQLVQYVSDQLIVNLTEIDLSAFAQIAAQSQLAAFRDDYQHAVFDLNQSPWNVTIFKLPADQVRVFVRFDALIFDGRSISALMLELFTAQSSVQASQDLTVHPVTAQARQDDQQYWENKLAQHIQIPKLPWRQALNKISTSRYRRQSRGIPRDKFQQLSKIGAQQGLFQNAWIMAVLLEILAQHTKHQPIAVGIPVLPLYEHSFANQSTFIVATWQQNSHFVRHARQLQKNILEGLQHLAFSGVDLTRILFEQQQHVQRVDQGNKHRLSPVLPIVITNALSWPNLPASHPIKYINGLTQTPQVAIDIRFHQHPDGALIFDIDYAQAAISESFIAEFLLSLEKNLDHILMLAQHPLNRDQILNIYLQHLNILPTATHDHQMHFSHIGLRPSHLKRIIQDLNQSFAVRLSPLQLIQCRNVLEVEKLILLQTAPPPN